MSKRSAFLLFSAAVFVLTLAGSCTKDIGKPAGGPPPPVGACDTITWVKHIGPLLKTKCGDVANNGNGCHAPNGGNVAGINFLDEAMAQQKASRIKARAVDASSMPMSPETPLTPEQKSLVQCWIDNGMKH